MGSVLPKKINVLQFLFFYNIFAFFEDTVFQLKKCVGFLCQNLLKFDLSVFYVVPQIKSTNQNKTFGSPYPNGHQWCSNDEKTIKSFNGKDYFQKIIKNKLYVTTTDIDPQYKVSVFPNDVKCLAKR